ncbi:chemotaxis protein CheD [Uliginosibacterium sediminicola]|uniref:Probable chemoreceptor glutamine deamidase CheD n=1 Tax=Uliginosibacterium sediminicola TaxID=2024550 RepID=A0ABU9YUR7_9RHOO
MEGSRAFRVLSFSLSAPAWSCGSRQSATQMKAAPPNVLDVVIGPGELCFADAQTRIHTVLGSCVAITVWHPQQLIGGMCHYVLPQRPPQSMRKHAVADAYYADDAVRILLDEIRRSNTRLEDYRVKLFGGGAMFPGLSTGNGVDAAHEMLDVASRNVAAARELVERNGMQLVAEHVGGAGHRKVIFDVWSGDVWVQHSAPPQRG